MPGPAQKHPDARARRNAPPATTKLPVEGRTGRAPAWPLGPDVGIETSIKIAEADVRQLALDLDDAGDSRSRASLRGKLLKAQRQLLQFQMLKKHLTANEKKRWAELWKTPQATQWERLSWAHDVAIYVRVLLRAEAGSLDHVKEERQRAKALGLTPDGIKSLGWEIADAVASTTGPQRRSKRNSSKYRALKVVQ